MTMDVYEYRSKWLELYDPVTGQVYYYNAETNQSEWEPPAPTSYSTMGQTHQQQQQQPQEVSACVSLEHLCLSSPYLMPVI